MEIGCQIPELQYLHVVYSPTIHFRQFHFKYLAACKPVFDMENLTGYSVAYIALLFISFANRKHTETN